MQGWWQVNSDTKFWKLSHLRITVSRWRNNISCVQRSVTNSFPPEAYQSTVCHWISSGPFWAQHCHIILLFSVKCPQSFVKCAALQYLLVITLTNYIWHCNNNNNVFSSGYWDAGSSGGWGITFSGRDRQESNAMHSRSAGSHVFVPADFCGNSAV